MEKPRIVVVGSSNTDMIIKLDRIPQPGETILGGEFATAAGDVFNGALAVALGEGRPLLDAVRFANAAAAISVTRLGAQPSAPDREEIELLLTKANIATRAAAPERKLVKGGALPLSVDFASKDLKQNQLGE